MQKYFGKTNEPEIIKVYWRRLSKLSESQFQAACLNLLDSWRPTSQIPFPLIADFLAACGATGKARGQNALAALKDAMAKYGMYRSVDFNDPALHQTISRFGGWAKLCSWTQKDWNINEGRFLAAYEAALQFPGSGPQYLPGIAESQNQLNGHKYEKPIQLQIEGSGELKELPHKPTPLKLHSENRVNDVVFKLAEHFGEAA